MLFNTLLKKIDEDTCNRLKAEYAKQVNAHTEKTLKSCEAQPHIVGYYVNKRDCFFSADGSNVKKSGTKIHLNQDEQACLHDLNQLSEMSFRGCW